MAGNWVRRAALAALGAAALPAASAAQDSRGLPLRDVVLFSSGVGYFQRAGRVDGAADVELSFRVEQVNDVLKSLVLIDPAGGFRAVSYAGSESPSSRLRGARRSLDPTVSLGQLLRQYQGAQLRVWIGDGSEPEDGRLVSVSERPVPAPGRDGAVVTVDVLNLLTPAGLRAVPLDGVRRVELADERLARELQESLAALASGLDDQRRAVTLRFGAGGAREVRAGYLQEMPVWKTSYRLVLDEGQRPYLQGWAMVENTTDEDWRAVRLSLVSGRPISFIQDLYEPLYVPRPVVQAQVIGSPASRAFDEAVLTDQVPALRQQNADRLRRAELASAAPQGAPGQAGGGGVGFGGMGRALGLEARVLREELAVSAERLGKSVAAQATGAERGELFEYAIREPVTLTRGQNAMVPIVGTAVEGERISIYDPSSDPRRALNGFRLKNSTGLHLAGGPLTVIQGGIYAGDAQINHLRPAEDRLLAYAVDLDLVAARETPAARQDTVSISAKSGVLIVTRKQQRPQVYTFRSKSGEAKTVLVEQLIEPGFKLVEPAKAAETTADRYRFRVALPAGAPATLRVMTERPVSENVALLDVDLNVLAAYAQNARVSEKLRGALKQLTVHRRRIVDLQAKRTAAEGEIRTIDAEQARIRKNMEQLDRASPLYTQYVRKLTEQESRIEKLREEIARLRDAEAAAQKELREFVDGITEE